MQINNIHITQRLHQKKQMSDLQTLNAVSGKSAFTLAETLITIAIIGVVAVITMSAIINKYNELVTITKVKRFYSIMSQVTLMTINDNGTVNNWSWGGSAGTMTSAKASAALMEYFKPYLKIAKDCGTIVSGCIPDTIVKTMQGKSHLNYYQKHYYYGLILADGTCMWMRNNYNCGIDSGTDDVCALFWIDTGGVLKGTHTIGKDIFVFFLTTDAFISHTNNDCYTGGAGWGCAKHIITYGNMNYPESTR